MEKQDRELRWFIKKFSNTTPERVSFECSFYFAEWEIFQELKINVFKRVARYSCEGIFTFEFEAQGVFIKGHLKGVLSFLRPKNLFKWISFSLEQ